MQMIPHRARGVTEWFDENENDVNHILCSSLSPYFNSRCWSDTLDSAIEYLLEEWLFIIILTKHDVWSSFTVYHL